MSSEREIRETAEEMRWGYATLGAALGRGRLQDESSGWLSKLDGTDGRHYSRL